MVQTSQEPIEDSVLEKELLLLDEWVVDYYRQNVKNNESATLLQIKKKLTRNVLSSADYYEIRRRPNLTMYEYGYLRILVEDGSKITWIKNRVSDGASSINFSERKRLNRLFGLRSN